jgi:hypothetical protein
VTVWVAFVDAFVIVMVAPGTAAPVASWITPLRRPVEGWEYAVAAPRSRVSATDDRKRLRREIIEASSLED